MAAGTEPKPEEAFENESPSMEEAAEEAVADADPEFEQPEDVVSDPSFQLQQQVNDLKDQLLRTAAEMENVRKRAQRDMEENAKYAVAGFAKDVIGSAENLHRALASIPQEEVEGNPVLKNLFEGVDLTLREFVSTLERHGIRRVYPLGEKFDHNYHQAVAQIEDVNAAPGTVVQVLQAGYTLHDRLLKPALVGVAKMASPNPVDTAV